MTRNPPAAPRSRPEGPPAGGAPARAGSTCAIPHALARRPLCAAARRTACLLALGLVLALGQGCGGEDAEAAPGTRASSVDRAALERQIAELTAAFEPADPTWTSDRQDAWLGRQRAALDALRSGPPELAQAALAAFDEAPASAQVALLDVAAHCDPAGSRARLEELVRRYVPGLDLARAEAARLLAQTSPQAAVDLLRELLSDPPNATLPPSELLLRYWASAARRLGPEAFDAAFLADLATDLARPAELRYAAIEELGHAEGALAKSALRTLLVESSPDGLLRRKAAQALLELLPAEEACAIFEEVANLETEGSFLLFLADLLEKNCW